MATVAQALERFISSLELTESQRGNASTQQETVRGHLRKKLTLEGDFLSGSYARRTAIRPLNDIDLFVVLGDGEHGGLREKPPVETLQLIQGVLDDAYPNKEHPIIQTRSVHIAFAGTGIEYDIVPAFLEEDGSYVIPDRGTGTWIQTNPKEHERLSTEANEAGGKKLKPTFKAVKRWRHDGGKLGRSFHLEVLSWSAFVGVPASYVVALQTLFQHLLAKVEASCPDPAGLGPNIDGGMDPTERARLRDELEAASRDVDTAAAHAIGGRSEAAHYYLRRVFGAAYPEKGKKPVPVSSAGPVVSGACGPDASKSRFG